MAKFPDVLELNVGGTKITTFLSTLTKEPDSMLAAMFSGRHVISKDEKGRYFLDCDGGTFGYIINYLRFGTLPSEDKAVDVHALALYFGVQALKNELEYFKSVQKKVKINDIKSGRDAKQYNVIKTEVIGALKICHSYEDISLNLHVRQCSLGNELLTYKVKPAGIREICLHSQAELSGDMLWCLAEELHALGFGRYIYMISPRNSATCVCHFTRGVSLLFLNSNV